jgi:parvulin-like peptidyl-prolyl isomerase
MKAFRRFALGCALGLGLFPGCSVPREARSERATSLETIEQKPWGDPDHVIVEVNGRPITKGEFYTRVLSKFGTAEILSGLIKEELFLQEANRRGIKVLPQEADAKVNEIFSDMARKAGGEDELAKIYSEQGIGLSDLKRQIGRDVESQILISKVTLALQRKVDDDALRDYYKKTYRYTRYRIRHIAYSFLPSPGQEEGDRNRLKLEAFNKAVRAADRVRKGEADFAELARAESDDQVTASRGGDCGEFGMVHEDSLMEPALKKAILSLKPGEVSDPVENPNGGYHVFQVTQVFPSEGFSDCKERMREEMLHREPDLQEIEKALGLLRSEGKVRVFGLSQVKAESAAGTVSAPGGIR